MSEATTIKRITYKRKRQNPLFRHWLKILCEEAIKNKSKLVPMLKEAIASLSKYPLPLLTGAECIILAGFDKKLCQFLDCKLKVYNQNNKNKKLKKQKISNGQPSSQNSCSDNLQQTQQVSENANSNRTRKKVKKTKQYMPAHRSGGYAILLGLLEHSKLGNNIQLDKENLIEIAQKYSEVSFVRPQPDTFYTAWSNMRTLLTKKLVKKTLGKKAKYCLTDEGMILANQLLEENKNIPSINDQIFNHNNVMDAASTSPERVETPLDIATTLSHQNNNNTVYEMGPGSYDIILLIDKNETSGLSKKNDPTVHEFKKYPSLKHEYRSLKVGDFMWIAKHKIDGDKEFVLPYIVERKRMDDLGASIKDGRFHEQKFRLRKCGLKNVIYLIENFGKNKHVGLPVQSLRQAMANTRLQDQFKVHTTDSLAESVQYLAMQTNKLKMIFKDKTLKGYNQEPDDDEEEETDTLMSFDFLNKSSAKYKPLGVTDMFIKQLLQLKGLSVEKVLAITEAYNTPLSLFKAYETNDKKTSISLIANLKYNNVSRNVGPVVSTSIYHLFK